MGTTIEVEDAEFAGYIDDGEILPAKVISVKLEEKPYKDDETGEHVKKMVFRFRVNDPDSDFDGRDVWGETSTAFKNHPNCKLYNWSSSILGNKLPVGYRVDTDDLVQRDCRILVKLKEYEKNGEPKQRNFVDDVMPTKAAMEAMKQSIADEEPF